MPTATVTRTELYDAISKAFVKPPTTIAAARAEARDRGARQAVLDELAKVPDDATFWTIRDIWQHFPDMPAGE